MPRTLYVGNLDPSITEEFLSTLFGQVGVVTKAKVVYDPHSDPYAFIEFTEHNEAANALGVMNRRVLLERELKVNWATEPGQQQVKVDTSRHFHVFVGDLSPEIDNKVLKEAFIPFGEVSDVKVIRDPSTLKSKGYGFVSYPKREDAERAIEQMNGQWIGRRTIRTNWATRKPNEGFGGEAGGHHGGGGGGGGGGGYRGRGALNYDDVFNQTTADNMSVYIGGVAQGVSEEDIRANFQQFGSIDEIRLFKAQGYSFVRFHSKESACRAICEMSGKEMCGQVVRCSWGKTDAGGGAGRGSGPAQPGPGGYGYGYGSAGAYNQTQTAPAGLGTGAAGGYNQQYYQQYYNQYYQNPQYQHGSMSVSKEEVEREQEERKEYVKNIGIEYRYGCYEEKRPESCQLLAEYMEAIDSNFKAALTLYKENCETRKYPKSCFKYAMYLLSGKDDPSQLRQCCKNV
ncbi:unnamed protein product, partial [Mesorhabditis spiculigera]